ncbi:baseplate J/gp47 family protein [Neisseria sp. Dent CA1/247]|uniref:baseplate J/gp47 family protein n=1 Tax=Neisseria sp. Dent CA1/247 TaxID=2912675 RepID=UPI001FD21400|nr:baseplate J/gp47 family protein [Neisseria sp. Dent CA1/247]UOO77916.1 baseplate J/gp47 family protein [Neisseria sp. Dent CA1/247]
MKTNVPNIVIDDTGVKIPSETEILDGVLADFNEAFGGNLNLNLETPQGQLASSLAAIINDKNNAIAQIINQVHPDFAAGVMQDAVAKIYFLERKPETDSVVECEFTGLVGTVIPKGFIAKDEAGNRWTLQNQAVIEESGTVTAVLTSQSGTEARAGTVTQIEQYISGLDRVTNKQDAVAGRKTESREDFRERRKNSVAINAHGTPASVYANVFALDGVSDVYVVDNPKHTADTIGGVSLKPHSLYVAVVGGNDDEIARKIWKFAGSGCDFTGNTTVTVLDESYAHPKPSYSISFTRPSNAPIYFRVKVQSGGDLGYEKIMKDALIDAFRRRGKNKIGATIYAVDFVAPLSGMSGVNLVSVEVGLSNSNYASHVVANIDKIPVLSPENIQVVTV